MVDVETLAVEVDAEDLKRLAVRLAVPILVIQPKHIQPAEAIEAIRAEGQRAAETGVLVMPIPADVYWVTP